MKRVPAAISRTSQASASCVPAPMATPLIAATVGFSSRSTSEINDVSRCESWRNSRGSQSRSKRLRSPPALNALPAPVRITARTSARSAAPSKAARSAAAISPSIALRRSGRLSASNSTPSSPRSSVTSCTTLDGTVRRVIAGYQHFLRLASRVQWDAEAIDLSADARAWPVDDRITTYVAGFLVGEEGVAEHLRPFFCDDHAEAVFDVQKRDEERHARFFTRYAEAVGLSDPRAHVSDAFAELFETRLPQAAACDGVEAVG